MFCVLVGGTILILLALAVRVNEESVGANGGSAGTAAPYEAL